MKIWLIRFLLLVISIYFILAILLFLFQEKLLFNASALPSDFVFESDYPFQEIHLKTPDDGLINLVHYKGENPRGLIVFYHGNGRTLEHWMPAVEYLVKENFDLLLMDFRGYGKSTGKLSEAAMIKDALEVYEYGKKSYVEDKIIVYGRSMGTAFASQVAAKHAPAVLVLETPFKSILDLSQRRFPVFPNSLLLRYPLRSDLAAKDINCPVHIFHGTQDRVVPYASGKALADCYPNDQVYFHTIEGAQHSNVPSFSIYHQKMKAILSAFQ